MTCAYMPFTYLSESIARVLHALFGTVTLYQPLKTNIPEDIKWLSEQGLIEIRTPIDQENERLHAALSEFTEWSRTNPGTSTAGSDFLLARQGEVPFFGETAINRIRSEIRHHGRADREQKMLELAFRSRLFLSVAQENDRTADSLGQDLARFDSMEKDFFSTLEGAEGTRFNRTFLGASSRQEDQGAKQTRQRIRSWATLAAAGPLPEVWVATSPAVMDHLLEMDGEPLTIEKLIEIPLGDPLADVSAALIPTLDALARQETLIRQDFSSLEVLAAEPQSTAEVTLSLFAAMNRTPVEVLRHLAPHIAVAREETEKIHHTLIAFVEGCLGTAVPPGDQNNR